MKGEGWVARAVVSSDGKLLLVAGGARKPFNTPRGTEFSTNACDYSRS